MTVKSRQDAWTEENDLLLAETVLRHVREGSTQLNAFEEVGDQLNRTSAACGFRWNAVVRHQYEKALQLAKKQRKQRHRILGKDQGGKKKLLYQPPAPSFDDLDAMSLSMPEDDIPFSLDEFTHKPQTEEAGQQEPPVQEAVPVASKGEMSIEKVIAFLQQYALSNSDVYKIENQRLKGEIHELRKENETLAKKVNELENNTVTMQEDYETLMQIMNRARKLVLFDEDEAAKSPRFKMDRNGNLEKVAEG